METSTLFPPLCPKATDLWGAKRWGFPGPKCASRMGGKAEKIGLKPSRFSFQQLELRPAAPGATLAQGICYVDPHRFPSRVNVNLHAVCVLV